jgi:hypothetical protein
VSEPPQNTVSILVILDGHFQIRWNDSGSFSSIISAAASLVTTPSSAITHEDYSVFPVK